MVAKGRINTGEYFERWALQSVTAITKVNGKPVPTWTTYKTVWASVTEVTSSEMMIGLGLQEKASHLMKIKFYERVKANHRAVRGGRTINFVGVTNPDGKRWEMWIAALEIKDNVA